MKIKFTGIILLCGWLAASAEAKPTLVSVKVNGMVCAFCAQGITKKFKERPEVTKVTVKLADHKVYMIIKDGAVFPDETIAKLLHEAGFSVVKVTRKEI